MTFSPETEPHGTVVCAHCGAPLESDRHIGWFDARSGDEGGTYDYCPDNPEGGIEAYAQGRREDDSSPHVPQRQDRQD